MRKSIVFLFLIIVLGTVYSAAAEQTTQTIKRPNIVFILADDLGYGDISCFGQQKFQTPRIDQLASEGIRFTQMYAGTTVCAPSRCSLMTGYHTGHSAIRGNRPGKPFGDAPIPAETVTLTQILKQAGYSVGVFGKWGLGAVGNSGDPNRHGVDKFYGYYSQVEAHNYYPPRLHKNGKQINLDGKTYSHALIEGQALQFIRNNKDRPFFCYMPVTIPHAAMQVPESYMTPWRAQFTEFEDVIGRYSYDTTVRNPVAAFPAMLTRLDETVGRVLDTLEQLGLADNTIVIFSSDNGPHAEGGHRPQFFNSSGPFRGIKRDLYEGGIREPFIVRWPGQVKPGSESKHIAAFWDILPTLAEVAEAKTPDGIDGISFLPALIGDDANQPKHEYLYWEFHEQKGKRAVRWERFKAVQNRVNLTPSGPIEIYDVEQDPKELNNLASERPDLVQKAEEVFQSASTSWKNRSR